MTERFRVPFYDENNENISNGRPQICDERIFYERFDTSKNTTSIHMYNVENEYNELISPKNNIFKNFYPQVYIYIYNNIIYFYFILINFINRLLVILKIVVVMIPINGLVH